MIWNTIKMALGLMSYNKTIIMFTKAIKELKAMNDVHHNYIIGNKKSIKRLTRLILKHETALDKNDKTIRKLYELLS